MVVKVGVVGSGGVGASLASALLRSPAAFAVKYASRDPHSEKIKNLLAKQPQASADSVDNVVSWADALILAVPGANDDEGNRKIAASLGPNIKGKVLIDATNPLTAWPGLETRWTGKSGGEIISEALPGTHVFKAFNTVPNAHMEFGDGRNITGEQLVALFAGPQEGKDIVEQVIAGTGFKPFYVGPIRYARNLEAIAELWIHMGVPGVGTANKIGGDFYFQLIKKPTTD